MLFDGHDGEKILRDSFGIKIQQFADSFLFFRVENQADVFGFVDAKDYFGIGVM